MVESSLFGIAAIASAALFGLAFSAVALTFVRDGARHSWMQKRAGAGGLLDRILTNGAPILGRPTCFLLGFGLIDGYFGRIALAIRIKERDCEKEGVCSLLCLASLSGIAICWALGSLVAGFAFSACLAIVASSWASHVAERNRDLIREALPDAIRAMSTCFHAGFSLQQTFAQLAKELSGPVSKMFSKAKDAMDTGSSAEEALRSMRATDSVPEFAFISVALEVQHRAGGSLRHVLDSACESLEGELELRRSLKVQTAQARLSARVVTGVTIALMGLLSLLTEDFLAPFFSSALGVVMFACAIGMQCAGVLIVRRLLKVEVD